MDGDGVTQRVTVLTAVPFAPLTIRDRVFFSTQYTQKRKRYFWTSFFFFKVIFPPRCLHNIFQRKRFRTYATSHTFTLLCMY